MSKIEVGKIVNTHGIRGDVKINPFMDDVEAFRKFKYLYVKDNKVKVKGVKFVKNNPIVSLEGTDSVEKAELLRNTPVYIDEEMLPELSDNEFYIKDIINLNVETKDGEYLGKITDVFKTGSNDVYEILKEDGKKFLIPAISQVVKEINIKENKVTVELLEGLLWELMF